MRDWEDALHQFMDTNYPDLGATIAREKALSNDTVEKLRAAISEFKKTFTI